METGKFKEQRLSEIPDNCQALIIDRHAKTIDRLTVPNDSLLRVRTTKVKAESFWSVYSEQEEWICFNLGEHSTLPYRGWSRLSPLWNDKMFILMGGKKFKIHRDKKDISKKHIVLNKKHIHVGQYTTLPIVNEANYWIDEKGKKWKKEEVRFTRGLCLYGEEKVILKPHITNGFSFAKGKVGKRVPVSEYSYDVFVSKKIKDALSEDLHLIKQFQFQKHSGGTTRADVKIGVEFEKEDVFVLSKINKIFNEGKVLPKGWIVSTDCSLSSAGFEAVTPAYDLYSDALLDDIAAHPILSAIVGAHFTEKAGGHISISKKNMTPLELMQALRPWIPLIYVLQPHRLDKGHSVFKTKFEAERSDTGRKAIALRENRVEIRIFDSPCISELKFRISLLRIIMSNLNLNSKEVEHMLKDDTSYLHALLSERFDMAAICFDYKRMMSLYLGNKRIPNFKNKTIKKAITYVFSNY